MICSSCGTETNATDALCSNCGAPTAAVAATAMASPLPPAPSPPLTASTGYSPPPPVFSAPPPPAAAAFPAAPNVPAVAAATPAPLTSRVKNCTVVLLVGGVILAIGSRLDWETATVALGTSSATGPSLLLILGVAVAILAIMLLTRNVKGKAAIATLVISVVALLDAVVNTVKASNDVNDWKDLGADASLGSGPFVAIVGCLMAGVASILLLRTMKLERTPSAPGVFQPPT